jgi:hypothetical protein
MVAGMMMPRTPFALQDVVSGFHVLEAAIGAAADDHLVDFDVLALAGGVGVLGQVGVADSGLKCREVDFNGLLILGVRVGLIEHRLAGCGP